MSTTPNVYNNNNKHLTSAQMSSPGAPDSPAWVTNPASATPVTPQRPRTRLEKALEETASAFGGSPFGEVMSSSKRQYSRTNVGHGSPIKQPAYGIDEGENVTATTNNVNINDNNNNNSTATGKYKDKSKEKNRKGEVRSMKPDSPDVRTEKKVFLELAAADDNAGTMDVESPGPKAVVTVESRSFIKTTPDGLRKVKHKHKHRSRRNIPEFDSDNVIAAVDTDADGATAHSSPAPATATVMTVNAPASPHTGPAPTQQPIAAVTTATTTANNTPAPTNDCDHAENISDTITGDETSSELYEASSDEGCDGMMDPAAEAAAAAAIEHAAAEMATGSSTASTPSQDFTALLERAARLEDQMKNAETRLQNSAARSRAFKVGPESPFTQGGSLGKGTWSAGQGPPQFDLSLIDKAGEDHNDTIDRQEAIELRALEVMVSRLHEEAAAAPLQEVIEEKENEIANLKEKVKMAEMEAEQRRLSRGILADELELLRATNQRLQQEALRAELEAHEREIAEKSERVNAMSVVSQHVNGILAKSQEEVARAEAELEALSAAKEAEIASLKAAKDELESKLKSIENANESEKEELEARAAELEAERATLQEQRKSIAKHRQSISGHRQSIARHRESIDRQRSELQTRVESEVEIGIADKHAEYENEKAELEAAVALVAEQKRLAEEREIAETEARLALAAEIEALRDDIAAMEAEKKELHDNLLALDSERLQTAEEREELRGALMEAHNDKALVRSANVALQKDVNVLKCEKFKIELEGNNHINELIDELSSMQRALSCEREEKQCEVAARERIAGEMRAMKTELDKSEAAIARKIKEMNTEIARLEAAADAREREFAAEQTRRDEEKSALGMRVKELEFEIHSQTQKYEREARQIKSMIKELAKAQKHDRLSLSQMEAEAIRRAEITRTKNDELRALQATRGPGVSKLVVQVRQSVTAWHQECAMATIRDAMEKAKKDHVLTEREETINKLTAKLDEIIRHRDATIAEAVAEANCLRGQMDELEAAIAQRADEVAQSCDSWRGETKAHREEIAKLQHILKKIRRRSNVIAKAPAELLEYGEVVEVVEGVEGETEAEEEIHYVYVDEDGNIIPNDQVNENGELIFKVNDPKAEKESRDRAKQESRGVPAASGGTVSSQRSSVAGYRSPIEESFESAVATVFYKQRELPSTLKGGAAIYSKEQMQSPLRTNKGLVRGYGSPFGSPMRPGMSPRNGGGGGGGGRRMPGQPPNMSPYKQQQHPHSQQQQQQQKGVSPHHANGRHAHRRGHGGHIPPSPLARPNKPDQRTQQQHRQQQQQPTQYTQEQLKAMHMKQQQARQQQQQQQHRQRGKHAERGPGGERHPHHATTAHGATAAAAPAPSSSSSATVTSTNSDGSSGNTHNNHGHGHAHAHGHGHHNHGGHGHNIDSTIGLQQHQSFMRRQHEDVQRKRHEEFQRQMKEQQQQQRGSSGGGASGSSATSNHRQAGRVVGGAGVAHSSQVIPQQQQQQQQQQRIQPGAQYPRGQRPSHNGRAMAPPSMQQPSSGRTAPRTNAAAAPRARPQQQHIDPAILSQRNNVRAAEKQRQKALMPPPPPRSKGQTPTPSSSSRPNQPPMQQQQQQQRPIRQQERVARMKAPQNGSSGMGGMGGGRQRYAGHPSQQQQPRHAYQQQQQQYGAPRMQQQPQMQWGPSEAAVNRSSELNVSNTSASGRMPQYVHSKMGGAPPRRRMRA